VKWTLENRSDSPGIRDGDMFLANDTWVGAAHQMDVMLLARCSTRSCSWVTNCLHQYDIAHHAGVLLPIGPMLSTRASSSRQIKIVEEQREFAGY
jgi:hypothetical protein